MDRIRHARAQMASAIFEMRLYLDHPVQLLRAQGRLVGWSVLYVAFLLPSMVVLAVPLGLLFVPLTTVAMADMPVTEVGNASSLFNLVRNIGSSVGIAAVGTLVTRARVFHFATLGEHLSPYNPTFQIYVERFKAAMAGRAMVSDQSATLATGGPVGADEPPIGSSVTVNAVTAARSPSTNASTRPRSGTNVGPGAVEPSACTIHSW